MKTCLSGKLLCFVGKFQSKMFLAFMILYKFGQLLLLVHTHTRFCKNNNLGTHFEPATRFEFEYPGIFAIPISINNKTC